MNYETLYNEMKHSLFTAVKSSADVLLELIRQSKNNTTEFETARHRYNTLYEQIDRCNLVEDYEEWEWLTEDGGDNNQGNTKRNC